MVRSDIRHNNQNEATGDDSNALCYNEGMETKSQDTRQQSRACCGVWALILVGLLPLLIYAVLTAAGGILIVGDNLRRADVVVLLGGGDPQRLDEAVRLYHDRYAALMVMTETGESDPKTGLLYSQLQKEAAMADGVPQTGIVFTEKHGNNTYDEARAVRKLLEQASGRINSAIIVTDPYHTLRTRLIYREIFKDSKIKIYVRPVRGHWYRSTTWWQSRAGWEATITEYAKLFAYFMGVRKD